jgi:hypothetical protein
LVDHFTVLVDHPVVPNLGPDTTRRLGFLDAGPGFAAKSLGLRNLNLKTGMAAAAATAPPAGRARGAAVGTVPEIKIRFSTIIVELSTERHTREELCK